MHTNLLTGHVPAYIKRQFSLLITLTYLFSQTNPVCTGFIPQQNTVRSKHGHVNSCGDSECCCPLSNVQYVKVCPPVLRHKVMSTWWYISYQLGQTRMLLESYLSISPLLGFIEVVKFTLTLTLFHK